MEEDAELQKWHKWFYEARGIGTPCERCGGSGIRTYPNTATWRSRPGIVSGQAMTDGVCDRCWGSGDDKRHGLDLRKIMGELDECRASSKGIESLRAEVERLKAKLTTAENEVANLRAYAKTEVNRVRGERDEARKERDDLRLRGYAELSMLAEDVLCMVQECYPSTASPRDREILHRHGEAMATKILKTAMEVRGSWPRTGVVDGVTRMFPTHAELDEATKERDSLRALLTESCSVIRSVLEPLGEECRLDHHGLCQEHHLRTNEAGDPECEVALAKAFLAKAAAALGAAR